MTPKERLQRVVAEMSDAQAEDILRSLDVPRGETPPLSTALEDVPVDDEPLTAEESESIAEARDELTAGSTVSLEDLRRELT